MDTTKGSYQKLDDKSKEFADELKEVLEMFEATNLFYYKQLIDNKKYDKFRETFITKKGDSVDTCSVMNSCIDKLKEAVKGLDSVCTKFTKSFSEGGFFSVSNTYLKKISKSAKAFYRDLCELKPAKNRETCKENIKKFNDDYQKLMANMSTVSWLKVKTFKNSAKIKNEKVKYFVDEIARYIARFFSVYNYYMVECFEK